MHRKLSGRAALAAATLTVSCALATAWSSAPAQAAGGSGSCSSGGGSSGGGGGSGGNYKIWAALSTHEDMCAGGGNVRGDGSSAASVHIACWWGEVYDPTGLKAEIQSFASQGSTSNWYMMLQSEYDKNGTDPLTSGYHSTDPPPWESYNIGADPAGNWYGLILNSGDTLDELQKCTDEEDAHSPEIYYWGVNGAPADLPTDAPGLSAKDLAIYVDSVINLPNADVSTNPPGKSTVKVPVWYWQNAGGNTVTIDNICAFGICVDFHAQAVSFQIETAGAPATIKSGGCTLNKKTGVLGTPYSQADKNTASSCGVTYTAPGTGNPVVKTFWHVVINWPGGTWSPPADGYIETTMGNVPVQEIQAVNPTLVATGPGH